MNPWLWEKTNGKWKVQQRQDEEDSLSPLV